MPAASVVRFSETSPLVPVASMSRALSRGFSTPLIVRVDWSSLLFRASAKREGCVARSSRAYPTARKGQSHSPSQAFSSGQAGCCRSSYRSGSGLAQSTFTTRGNPLGSRPFPRLRRWYIIPASSARAFPGTEVILTLGESLRKYE